MGEEHTSESISEKVAAIVMEQFGLNTNHYDVDTSFRSYGCDSLDMTELSMQITEEFGITLSNEDIASDGGNAMESPAMLIEHLTGVLTV